MFFKMLGFAVAALAVVGVLKTVYGVTQGTDRPQDIQRNINQEFVEVGVAVPPEDQSQPYDPRLDPRLNPGL